MAYQRGVTVTFFLSQTAWIILFCADKVVFIKTHLALAIPIGFLCLTFNLYVFLYFVLPPKDFCNSPANIERRGFLYYSCCIFCWYCIAHFIFYLEARDRIEGFFATYYIKNQEPYLETSFGALSYLWDGIVHYAFNLRLIYCIDNGLNYYTILLVYIGSLLASKGCLFLGVLTGKFACYSFNLLTHIPALVIPSFLLLKAIHEPWNMGDRGRDRGCNELRPVSSNTQSKTQLGNSLKPASPCAPPPIAQRCFNQKVMRFWLSYGIFMSLAYFMVRGLGVLGSNISLIYDYAHHVEPYLTEPSKFGFAWVILLLLFGSLFEIYALFTLYKPGCAAVLNWSFVYLGFTVCGSMLMFAQFCCEDSKYRPPDSVKYVVILGNLFVCSVAAYIVFLVSSEKAFFLKAKRE